MATLADNLLAHRANLETTKRQLEADLETTKEAIKVADEQLLEEWAERGVSSMKAHGFTFYLSLQLWAGHKGDKAATVRALKRNGLKEVVREDYNTQTLSAVIRGMVKEANLPPGAEPEQALPPKLAKYVKISEVQKVGVRKA